MGVLKIKQSKYDSHEERWTLERPEFAQAAHSFLIQKQGYEMKKKKKMARYKADRILGPWMWVHCTYHSFTPKALPILQA